MKNYYITIEEQIVKHFLKIGWRGNKTFFTVVMG